MKILLIIIAVLVGVALVRLLEKNGTFDFIDGVFFKSSVGSERYKNFVSKNPKLKSRNLKKLFKLVSDQKLGGLNLVLYEEKKDFSSMQTKIELVDLYENEEIEKVFDFLEKTNLGENLILTSIKFKNIESY